MRERMDADERNDMEKLRQWARGRALECADDDSFLLALAAFKTAVEVLLEHDDDGVGQCERCSDWFAIEDVARADSDPESWMCQDCLEEQRADDGFCTACGEHCDCE